MEGIILSFRKEISFIQSTSSMYPEKQYSFIKNFNVHLTKEAYPFIQICDIQLYRDRLYPFN